MKNDYLEDNRYTEMVYTLEDFHYDTKVKCAIPSLCPNIDIPRKDMYNNIMNKDSSNLDMSKCNQTNYLELYIPLVYMGYDNWDEGKKGTKFLVTFCGGDQNNCQICGRWYE